MYRQKCDTELVYARALTIVGESSQRLHSFWLQEEIGKPKSFQFKLVEDY